MNVHSWSAAGALAVLAALVIIAAFFAYHLTRDALKGDRLAIAVLAYAAFAMAWQALSSGVRWMVGAVT